MISEHPTWYIIDSSKLDDWMQCNRLYFFKHILGWRPDRPAHDLYFGNAWHIAREYQLIHGYEDVEGAFAAFMEFYRKEFSLETDSIYTPKDPTGVAMALVKFAKERKSDLIDNELLFTETSGTVLINEQGRVLHYRMDSGLRRKSDDKVFSWDHKSAKGGKLSNRTWSEKFHLSIQNGTYTHCLYCMYPIEQVLGIEFCGTEFKYLKKTQEYVISFLRVPAWKTPDQMNVWLWNVNDYYDDIERDMDRLAHCSENDPVMTAFQMNTTSCTNFWGCDFHDYCLAWENPLRHCYEPPLGFRIEFWNPSEMETTNKKNLEWR